MGSHEIAWKTWSPRGNSEDRTGTRGTSWELVGTCGICSGSPVGFIAGSPPDVPEGSPMEVNSEGPRGMLVRGKTRGPMRPWGVPR